MVIMHLGLSSNVMCKKGKEIETDHKKQINYGHWPILRPSKEILSLGLKRKAMPMPVFLRSLVPKIRTESIATPHDDKWWNNNNYFLHTACCNLLDSRESEDIELSESDNYDVSECGDGESEKNSEPLAQDLDNLQIDDFIKSSSQATKLCFRWGCERHPNKNDFLTDVLTWREVSKCWESSIAHSRVGQNEVPNGESSLVGAFTSPVPTEKCYT